MTTAEEQPIAGDGALKTQVGDKWRSLRAVASELRVAWHLVRYFLPHHFVPAQVNEQRRDARLAARRAFREWNTAWMILRWSLGEDATEEAVAELKRNYRVCSRQFARRQMRRSLRTAHSGTVLGLFTVFAILASALLLWGSFAAVATVLFGGLLATLLNIGYLGVVIRLATPSTALPVHAGLAAGFASLGYVLLPPAALSSRERLKEVVAGYDHLAAVILLLVGATGILLLGSFLVMLSVLSVIERRDSSPRVQVMSELLRLTLRAKRNDAFALHSDRQAMILHLHRSARILRGAFPNSISLPDADQRAIFEDRCHRAAASLEMLQIWVALPKADTDVYLLRSVTQFLRVLLLGNYDDLPSPELPHVTASQRMRQIGRAIKTLLIGAVPVIVLIGLKQAEIRVEGILGSGITVFCVLWASVTYLSILDPLLTQRLSMIRDLIATVRAGGNQKEA